MKNIMLLILLMVISKSAIASHNLILVTIDGLRWQEVFRGADPNLLHHKKFVKNAEHLANKFWHNDEAQRREKLLPFLWQNIAKNGVIIGNRDIGSKMSVANSWYFSYPGYSEIFTGYADNRINSNAKIPNPNVSFLEWLNTQAEFSENLAAFGSWDVFPYIFNVERSGLHVNAGFDSASGYEISDEIKLLNELQKEIPSPWHNVRLDSFTHRFAKDYLTIEKPRVMVISYGETDDFAHDGRYDHYLNAAKRTDAFIKDLWQTVQSMDEYKDKTTLMITTDHGRGDKAEDWQHHASVRAIKGYMKSINRFEHGIVGSEHIWFAAIGPNIQAKGQVVPKAELKQSQIAATALTLLNKNPMEFSKKAAPAISEVLQ